jgi:hypothetical protein
MVSEGCAYTHAREEGQGNALVNVGPADARHGNLDEDVVRPHWLQGSVGVKGVVDTAFERRGRRAASAELGELGCQSKARTSRWTEGGADQPDALLFLFLFSPICLSIVLSDVLHLAEGSCSGVIPEGEPARSSSERGL